MPAPPPRLEPIIIQDVHVPPLLYGTAWKEDDTTPLTRLALERGFRGIDTANQRRHYFEAGVGAALEEAIEAGVVRREDLFLQTKFTHRNGQDHRLPYDPEADVATQVQQSFESSLEHLGVEVIDSYVLHGPATRYGWSQIDQQTWSAMEALHQAGRARLLGVSNVSATQLEALLGAASVPPAFVQNRCFAVTGWDRDVRRICDRRGIVYQGFSLLTANPQILSHPHLRPIVERTGRTPAQVVFRFALQLGMIALTGTTQAGHMDEDLAVAGFDLDEREMRAIEALGA